MVVTGGKTAKYDSYTAQPVNDENKIIKLFTWMQLFIEVTTEDGTVGIFVLKILSSYFKSFHYSINTRR